MNISKIRRMSLTELENLPTLCKGQSEDLKIEEPNLRVWLCRCGIADGMPYDNQVSIEERVHDRWVVTHTWETS